MQATADRGLRAAAQAANLPEAESTVQQLEREGSDAAVWEDPGKAQALMQRLAAAKERCEQVQQLTSLAADVETALELAEVHLRSWKSLKEAAAAVMHFVLKAQSLESCGACCSSTCGSESAYPPAGG